MKARIKKITEDDITKTPMAVIWMGRVTVAKTLKREPFGALLEHSSSGIGGWIPFKKPSRENTQLYQVILKDEN